MEFGEVRAQDILEVPGGFRFGLELEFDGPKALRAVSNSWASRYVDPSDELESFLRETLPPGERWDLKEDGTLARYGQEFIWGWGGRLFWSERIDLLERLLMKIESLGYLDMAHGGYTCGCHIHVSMARHHWFSPVGILLLRHLWASVQDTDWTGFQSSTRNTWARPQANLEFTDEVTDLSYPAHRESPRKFEVWTGDHRYQQLNLEAVHSHGTVEFRLFDATYELSGIQAIFHAVTGQVAQAVAGVEREIPEFAAWERMKDREAMADLDIREFVLDRWLTPAPVYYATTAVPAV